MAKRRPTAEDRDVADYFRRLPEGKHDLIVEIDGTCPPYKTEGGMILTGLPKHRRLVVIPEFKSRG